MFYIYIERSKIYISFYIYKDLILAFEAIWMDHKVIMLNATSQKEKNKYCSTSLICGTKKNPNSETDIRFVVARGRGRG